MTDGTFERVSDTDKRLYGPRKIAFCGFPARAQQAVAALLDMVALGDVETLFLADAHAEETVGALFNLPHGTGVGQDSGLPRAIIVGGVTERELQQLMGGARAARMKPPLWAVLTPISETWPLAGLLKELAAERAALGKNAPTGN